MDQRGFDDDPWLAQFSEVPPELRPILRQSGTIRNVNLAHAIATELGLLADLLHVVQCKTLLGVMALLAGHVEPRDPIREGAAVAYAATEGLSVCDVRDVLIAFAGGNLRIETSVSLWDVDARKLLADHLTPYVQAALARWANRGLGPKPSNRRQSRSRR